MSGKPSATSLFCLTLVLDYNGGKKKNDELAIVKAAQKAKVGVFACDKWEVFSNKV